MTEQSEAGHVGAPASYASRKWSMTNGRRAALIGLCAVLPHLPALFAGFTYDDEDFFVRNQSIRSLGSALRTFISSFPPNEPESGRFRPLTNLSYAVDAALGGGAPFLPHLSKEPDHIKLINFDAGESHSSTRRGSHSVEGRPRSSWPS